MHYDYLFVGGGLASALGVLALLEAEPDLRICVVEREAALGGNHTWCFHSRDVSSSDQRWVEPLIVQRWPGYQVRFPRRVRRLASPYACVTSDRLHDVLSEKLSAPGCRLLLDKSVTTLEPDQVLLDDGAQLRASVVLDARGPNLSAHQASQGFQKFVGLEVRAEPPTSLKLEPVLMDARLPQHDGFRFMYLLPFQRDRWLIEETFFSDDASLDRDRSARNILKYAAEQGFRVHAVLREEHGVLPMPWRADPETARENAGGILRVGYRGGFFHPATGYSFPIAARYASALASSHPNALAPHSPLAHFAADHFERQRFLFFLTRMMFGLFEPERRFEVLEHFYRLPEHVIERFYAAHLSRLDCARLFLGAPPRGLSFRRALGLGRSLPLEQSL